MLTKTHTPTVIKEEINCYNIKQCADEMMLMTCLMSTCQLLTAR